MTRIYVPGDPVTRTPEFKAWCEAEGIDYYATFRLEVTDDDHATVCVGEFCRAASGAFYVEGDDVARRWHKRSARVAPPVLPTPGFAEVA